MKFVIECDVRSEILLTRRLELRKNGRTFIFDVDDQKRWNKLKVVAPVTDPSKFKWGMVPVPEPRDPNQAPYSVQANPDPELFDSIVSDIQCLESTVSVFFPVRAIDWRYPTMGVESEEGDERDSVWGDLASIRIQPLVHPPVLAKEKVFVSISYLAFNSQALAIIESFWREGESQLATGKFINAFFNYYFVLEGLYGDQQTKNRLIEAAFKKSKALGDAIDQYLKSTQPTFHLDQLHNLLASQKKNATHHETWISLLVSTRSRLHHFANNPNRPHGSPLNHHEYEGITMFTRFLAHKGLVAAALKIKADGYQEISSDS